jgi:hypothetical protein
MGCRWFNICICLTNRSHLGVGTKEGPNKSRKWFKIFTSPQSVYNPHMDQMVFMA